MKQTFPEIILFLLLLILNVSAAFIYNLNNEIALMIPIRLGAALINGMGISLFLTLTVQYISKYFKIKIASFLIWFMWILLVVECFLLLNFYTLLTPSVVMVILETNQSEASEFFISYFNAKTWSILIVIVVLSILIICNWKRLQSIQWPAYFKRKSVLWSLCIVIGISYAGLTYYVTQVRHMTSYQMLTGIERLWHSSKTAFTDRIEYEKYKKITLQTPPVVTVDEAEIPYVVVILGESLSKLHMSAYGYNLSTTPNLNKRIKNGETFLFDSVCTPRTITSEAIRQIMSFYSNESDKPWYYYHTLPALMKAAGYITFWLSNQDSFTIGDNNSTAGIAFTSSVVQFAHQKHASEERYGYFDGDLLPLLEECINNGESKKFVCLHLMGSHRRYTNRYPSEFNKFGVNDIEKDQSTEIKRTISEYDNTVLYNDFVCEEIIKQFEEKDAIVFCFPDHGEEVYDTRNMCGHSLDNPSIPMKEIPFWIWTSDTFRENRLLLLERIASKVSHPFNTTNFIHTLIDICGMNVEQYQCDKSLLYN